MCNLERNKVRDVICNFAQLNLIPFYNTTQKQAHSVLFVTQVLGDFVKTPLLSMCIFPFLYSSSSLAETRTCFVNKHIGFGGGATDCLPYNDLTNFWQYFTSAHD